MKMSNEKHFDISMVFASNIEVSSFLMNYVIHEDSYLTSQ